MKFGIIVVLGHFLTSGVCWRDRVSGCDGYGGNVGKEFTLVAMVFSTLGVRWAGLAMCSGVGRELFKRTDVFLDVSFYLLIRKL